MSNFISEASAELEHVVWPTPAENKKYMIYTIGVIVVLGVFLAVLGYAVTNGLAYTRSQFPHDAAISTVSGEDSMTQEDVNNLIKNITPHTGSTSATTGSGIKTLTKTGGVTATGSR